MENWIQGRILDLPHDGPDVCSCKTRVERHQFLFPSSVAQVFWPLVLEIKWLLWIFKHSWKELVRVLQLVVNLQEYFMELNLHWYGTFPSGAHPVGFPGFFFFSSFVNLLVGFQRVVHDGDSSLAVQPRLPRSSGSWFFSGFVSNDDTTDMMQRGKAVQQQSWKL